MPLVARGGGLHLQERCPLYWLRVDGRARIVAHVVEREVRRVRDRAVDRELNVQNALAGKQIKNVIVRAPKLVNIATETEL